MRRKVIEQHRKKITLLQKIKTIIHTFNHLLVMLLLNFYWRAEAAWKLIYNLFFNGIPSIAAAAYFKLISKFFSVFFSLLTAKNNFYEDKPHRLCLDVGDSVIISGECTNWYYGYRKT